MPDEVKTNKVAIARPCLSSDGWHVWALQAEHHGVRTYSIYFCSRCLLWLSVATEGREVVYIEDVTRPEDREALGSIRGQATPAVEPSPAKKPRFRIPRVGR